MPNRKAFSSLSGPTLLLVLVLLAGCTAPAPPTPATPTPSQVAIRATSTPRATQELTPAPTNTPMLTPTPKPKLTVQVAATVETDPVPHKRDAADDPAIWIHPTDRSLSTIIATDKQGGLAVYDLSGREIQYLADGLMNNVDLRYNFPLGGRSVTLVMASRRKNDTDTDASTRTSRQQASRVAIYRVNPATRRLENVATSGLTTQLDYGACMYHSWRTGMFYYFVNSERGEVEQWELHDNGSGQVDATLVRSFDVGSQTEGCVADDELGYFYIGEEAKGIWKYGAEPEDGTTRTRVDRTGAGGYLTADVEGLAIYYASNGTGYLIASSQGSDEYVVYEREGNNNYIMSFTIEAGNGIDAVSGTDGIDVTSASLGSAFPQGVFVVQDGENADGNQNFKLVPWQAIATAMTPPLTIEPSWDPRRAARREPAD